MLTDGVNLQTVIADNVLTLGKQYIFADKIRKALGQILKIPPRYGFAKFFRGVGTNVLQALDGARRKEISHRVTFR